MSADADADAEADGDAASRLGLPRLHLRLADSTNTRARELATAGAPHGTLVTADEQNSGRGRQGRQWTAPAGRALLCSLVLRDPPRLLPLAAGVAVAETVAAVRPVEPVAVISRAIAAGEAPVQVKWPNDILLRGRKVAGILVEGRPQERWAVLGVGLNVALRPGDFPPELRQTAGTLALAPDAIEPTLTRLLSALARWLSCPEREVLDAVRIRDALLGRPVRWEHGEGRGAGIDSDGRLLVSTSDGEVALDAGEVHLGRSPAS